ncbi:WD40-repeat-containing domain protein, partial [Desarmillaria ectypa]
DGTYLLISSCKDGNPMLREWTGDWIGTFLGHKGAVWSTKLSPDASRAASGSADSITAKEILLHSFPHNHIVRSVALSPTSSHLLTGGQEKKVRMFDLGRPDADPDYPRRACVVWVGDHTGVTAGEDGLIKWWDLRTRTLTNTMTFPKPITSMELSPQTGRLIVTSGFKRDNHGSVHCVEFSPDGGDVWLAQCCEDGKNYNDCGKLQPGKTYGLWQGQTNGG